MIFPILVTCPKGLEYLLEEELISLGLTEIKVSPQGVYGAATLSLIYKISLWSRIANRVLLILLQSTGVTDPKQLHALCYQLPWQSYFHLPTRLAIRFQGTSPNIRSTMFGAQVIKDAIVDYCRAEGLERPVIDREHPNVCLRAYLHKEQVMLCLDLVGHSLHQRGYRLVAGEAPLKENVAVALLKRAKWGEDVPALYDPFCGSGTIVIEAAMMAARIAPGLLREDHAFSYWLAHDSEEWARCRASARQQQVTPQAQFYARDVDPKMITIGQENAARAGVAAYIQWEVEEVAACSAPSPTGLVIGNPPYGERLSDVDALMPVYQALGERLHQSFSGWRAAILTANQDLAKAIGLRAHKHYKIYNGTLVCQLYCIHIDAHNALRSARYTRSVAADMFANRLRKNKAHLQKWAKRQGIECYRLYDADLPEYAFAIDIYPDHAVLQEYAPPASIPNHVAEQRRFDVMSVVPEVIHIPAEQVIVKRRMRQRGDQQYEKLADQRQFLTVIEGKARLLVNLWNYLDTGLFLDHRLLRLRFAQLTPGTRFLNCFCYTGSASVHAALVGAITTNVDLSNTYLGWAEDNYRLNGLDVTRHQFVQTDCLEWLKHTRDIFDVIFLDPPSFSNSKRMSGVLDIARDHVVLIQDAMRLLSPKGVLYFSTNLRHFKLDTVLFDAFVVEDISEKTIDKDFKNNPHIHRCYRMVLKDSGLT
jgi:23S rRNA (guanine2445-N2)-methyltransferase / 23S rRNA (guanine2069-N7)-methyltransferase